MVALAQALTITHQSWCRFVCLMVARQAFLVQIDPIAIPAPSAPDSRLTSIPAHHLALRELVQMLQTTLAVGRGL